MICVTFATLLRSGIPALQALTIVKGIVGNKVMERVVDEVHDKIMPASEFTLVAALSFGSWIFGLLWMIFDVFLILCVHRRAGERARPREMGTVFT